MENERWTTSLLQTKNKQDKHSWKLSFLPSTTTKLLLLSKPYPVNSLCVQDSSRLWEPVSLGTLNTYNWDAVIIMNAGFWMTDCTCIKTQQTSLLLQNTIKADTVHSHLACYFLHVITPSSSNQVCRKLFWQHRAALWFNTSHLSVVN